MYIFLSNLHNETKEVNMKTTISQQGVRLVGKSWEIRSRLRDWSRSSLTVQEFIQRQISPLRPNSIKKQINQ